VFNYLSTEYNLQLDPSAKIIGNKDKPSTVEEMRAELSLYFERLNINSTRE
jgi:hypothetical protein